MRLTSLATLLVPLAALSAVAAPTPEVADLVARDESELAVARAFGAVDPATGSIANVERELASVEVEARSLARRAVTKDSYVTASSGVNSIKSLQHLLNARGYKCDVDGILGAGTKAQISAFQKAKGLTVDGSAGPDTLSALIKLVQSGENSQYGKAAQEGLNKYGYGLTVDGIFGAASVAAAKKLQAAKGLTADGVIGGNTWSLFYGGSPGGGGGATADCGSVTTGVPQSSTELVGNFRVHKCWAPAIRKMVAAAKADGVTLIHNSSWRDPATQIALRKQNCGTTQYDIYQKPSTQCNPPTAIPGSSRHERGLAIDFGSCQIGTKCHNWLKANAGKYHVINWPVEFWHWSYDGK